MKSLIWIILVTTPGVWSGNWGVTLKNQCALKGTSVVISCMYDYPDYHTVRSVGWYKAQYLNSMWQLVPLSNLPSTRHRFKYVGNKQNDCGLRINNVQHTDEGAYFFHFKTQYNQWTSKTYAQLFVKELTTVVQPSTVTEGGNVSLTCVSGCSTPVNVVWFRDEQAVRNTVFQARREDAGRYSCAMLGQQTVRSKSVALNVQYAPAKVKLSVSPSGEAVKGTSVTFNCSSDANPPVTQSGYSLYKDGHFISSGQKHTISDIQPSHSGLYYCQAGNNISRRGINFINSTEIHLNVQYNPVNISISMNPLHVVGGRSVNLTCSSTANPPANYTWYKRTDSLSGGDIQVGSGQVLSIPSVEQSHTGLYLCQATNQLGGNNSTELLLEMMKGWKEEHGIQFLPVIAGIGVFLFVALVLAVVLFWRKRRAHAERKQPHIGLSGRGSSSSGTEDQPNTVYANIHALPSSLPAVTDISPHAQKSSHPEYDAPTAHEDEVTYSTVTITPKKPSRSRHINSRALQDPQSKSGENDEFVIYATVAKSS
ncbi:B-cell receptor CD22-like isoform X1 [Larimichthys crocea]|uniref:B-cell receptor CD22-like isoform X1 n=1 Tax=Larimichthys crocea TaxID=215358 RepID=UPI000F5E1856|nr:B-cell receptor CD22-like isoform X1 [Larimichthys crocea]XP_027141846.1 B-cell receptor CD22-like isoform X1 [Larimichthys crocea]